MNDIKGTIGVLCKHINKLYKLDMKPEHFRLAKHDKSDGDIVQRMWKLLNKLTVDNAKPSVSDVKDYFRNINYSSNSFYELPEDMSVGSREVLIAASLVLSEGIVNRIETILANSSFAENPQIVQNEDLSPQTELNIAHVKTKNDLFHFQKWLEGRIKNNHNFISEYELLNSRLLSLLKDNVYVDVDSLSVLEIFALNNRKYGERFLRESEEVLEVLQNHENWLKKSRTFWKWMVTVVEERTKNRRGKK